MPILKRPTVQVGDLRERPGQLTESPRDLGAGALAGGSRYPGEEPIDLEALDLDGMTARVGRAQVPQLFSDESPR
jgi:hypothetical protein